jgi:hypothetical protein
MFRYLIFTVPCIFVASTTSAQVGSEGNSPALRGLKSIDLLITGVDDEAQRCGITETLVRDAFLYPISQSKLQFLHYAAGATFFIRVNALIQRQPNQCISSLELSVMNYQMVQLDYADEAPTWAWVRLWDFSSIIVGEPLAERVRNTIDRATKKFLTTWNFVNKP